MDRKQSLRPFTFAIWCWMSTNQDEKLQGSLARVGAEGRAAIGWQQHHFQARLSYGTSAEMLLNLTGRD
jgi:hypothetical protein